jgi:hypothetical protein
VFDAYPEALTKEEIGELAGVSILGGTFRNWISELNTRLLIKKAKDGRIGANPELFS